MKRHKTRPFAGCLQKLIDAADLPFINHLIAPRRGDILRHETGDMYLGAA